MNRSFRILTMIPRDREEEPVTLSLPPQSPPTCTVPPRRGLLGGLAAFAAMPAAALAVANPDAALIAECAAAVDAKRAADAITYPLTFTIDQARPFDDESNRLLLLSDSHARRALAIPARTRAGLIAKARMALAIVPRNRNGTPDLDWHAVEAWAVVEDVLRLEALS